MKQYNINQIKELIPHRYPFLLIDKILDVEKGKTIKGIKNVTINEPFFQGHFPETPIMPGVLVIEGMAQLAAILAVLTEDAGGQGLVPIFRSIKNAKFKKMILPGDRIDYTITVLKQKKALWSLYGKAVVDGLVATEAEITAVFQKG